MREDPDAPSPERPSTPVPGSRRISAVWVAAGVGCGVLGWAGFTYVLPWCPTAVRFLVAWGLFTIGPGVLCAFWLTRDLASFSRVVVLSGIGSAAAAVLIDVLGRVGLVPVFPWLCAAALGGALANWGARSIPERPRVPHKDLIIAGLLVALALGLGTVAFWNRMDRSSGGVRVFGDYDSLDLTYYAAITAEASHTVPPTASYYAGHELNYAYYPQLVLAMVHRFADVPTLLIYLRYGWPATLALAALCGFVLFRLVAPAKTAGLAIALVLVGGDLSYLAAWFLPHDTVQWDYLLWPTNFLAPTMEVLHFSSWTPTLPVFFVALYAAARGLRTTSWGWPLTSALLLAVLVQFKPFAFAVLAAALVAAAVFSGRDLHARGRFIVTLLVGGICAMPFVYRMAALYADRRSRLLVDFFLLPRRMLIKLDLEAAFGAIADRIAPAQGLRRPAYLALATVVFLLVGPGIRWLGAAGVWKSLRGRQLDQPSAWRLLAWLVVAGVAIPFVLVTEPYNDTLQFYQTGLYIWWVFTASALVSLVAGRGAAGLAVAALLVAISLPSSAHYLARKWTDNTRPPRVALSRQELEIADFLRNTTDPEKAVVLHNRPYEPSLLTVVSERRVVLGWGRYAVGSEGRRRDVDRFFSSASGNAVAAMDMLRAYRVTHVVVHPGDAVHPDVLSQLQPLYSSSEASLYYVPPAP